MEGVGRGEAVGASPTKRNFFSTAYTADASRSPSQTRVETAEELENAFGFGSIDSSTFSFLSNPAPTPKGSRSVRKKPIASTTRQLGTTFSSMSMLPSASKPAASSSRTQQQSAPQPYNDSRENEIPKTPAARPKSSTAQPNTTPAPSFSFGMYHD
jgi:hypothetical protein